MPFKKGHRLSQTHGRFSFLAMGRAPKGCSYVYRLMAEFRRNLETAVLEKDGEVGMYKACLIQSAVRHESRAQLMTRYLRAEPNLSLADRLAVTREIGCASDSRDKCVSKLGLDRPESGTIVDALYPKHPPTDDEPHEPTADD